jgi:hypothetical protein
VATLACRASDRSAVGRADSTASDSSTAAVTSPAVPEAERSLAQYLDASVVTRLDSTGVVPDTLLACDDAAAPDPGYYLAAGRVLSSRRVGTGDSAVVRAEFVTAGEVRQSAARAGAFSVDVRARTDTAEWRLVRGAAGRWRVCGGPSTGGDFVRMGGAGSAYAWRPPAASWVTLASLADSVRRAGGLR